MSLQVWLPLNGDLCNQGLGKITSVSTTPKYREDGKLSNLAIDLSKRVTFTCPNLKNLQTFSIAFWAYVDNIESLAGKQWVDLFGFTDVSSSGSTGTFRFETCYDSSHGIAQYDNTTMALTNYNGRTYTQTKNIWKHCCVVFDNINHKVYTYRNGTKFATDTHNGGKFNTNGTFYIGETNNIAGMLQDLRIYNHALSDKEVEEISKGLILHYPLNNNGMGNPNILTGTYYNSYKSGLSASTTARNIDGKWAGGSGGNGSFSVTEDTTCPVGKYSWNVLNNTSGNRDFQQGDQPYVSGQIYTTSFWAKGSGTCLYRSWNSTDGKAMFSKKWTLTSNWTYYTYTFTASAEMETDSCTFHLGVTGASSISICGMKMEKGNYATPYSLAIGEITDNNTIYDTSGYGNNGTAIGTLTIATPSPRYDVCTVFNGTNAAIQVPNLTPEAITISFWMKRGANTGTRQFMYTAWYGITCELNTSGGPTFAVNRSSYPTITGNNITVASGWVHYCATFDIKNGMKLYQNGTLVASNSNLTPISYNISTNYIGLYNSNYYNGSMSDFRIYATALTAEQIKELYNTSMIIENDTIKPRDLE